MKLFVYGTLKRGFGNHRSILSGYEPMPAITKEPKYQLMSNGSFPAMVRGGEHRVIGEVYDISQETLERTDALEGNGHFYERGRVRVITEDGEEDVEAYFLNRTLLYGFDKDLPEESLFGLKGKVFKR